MVVALAMPTISGAWRSARRNVRTQVSQVELLSFQNKDWQTPKLLRGIVSAYAKPQIQFGGLLCSAAAIAPKDVVIWWK